MKQDNSMDAPEKITIVYIEDDPEPPGERGWIL